MSPGIVASEYGIKEAPQLPQCTRIRLIQLLAVGHPPDNDRLRRLLHDCQEIMGLTARSTAFSTLIAFDDPSSSSRHAIGASRSSCLKKLKWD
jgi:hypothetical protein